MVQLLCGSTVGYPSDSWAAGLIHGPLDSVLMNLDVYGLLYFVGLYTMTCQTRQTIQHYRGRRSASIYGRFAPPPLPGRYGRGFLPVIGRMMLMFMYMRSSRGRYHRPHDLYSIN